MQVSKTGTTPRSQSPVLTGPQATLNLGGKVLRPITKLTEPTVKIINRNRSERTERTRPSATSISTNTSVKDQAIMNSQSSYQASQNNSISNASGVFQGTGGNLSQVITEEEAKTLATRQPSKLAVAQTQASVSPRVITKNTENPSRNSLSPRPYLNQGGQAQQSGAVGSSASSVTNQTAGKATQLKSYQERKTQPSSTKKPAGNINHDSVSMTSSLSSVNNGSGNPNSLTAANTKLIRTKNDQNGLAGVHEKILDRKDILPDKSHNNVSSLVQSIERPLSQILASAAANNLNISPGRVNASRGPAEKSMNPSVSNMHQSINNQKELQHTSQKGRSYLEEALQQKDNQIKQLLEKLNEKEALIREMQASEEKLKESMRALSQEKSHIILLLEESERKLIETVTRTKEENDKTFELINEFLNKARGESNGLENNKEKLIEFLSGEMRSGSNEIKPSQRHRALVETCTQTVEAEDTVSQREKLLISCFEKNTLKLSQKLTEIESLAKALNEELEKSKEELRRERQDSAGKVDSRDYENVAGKLTALQEKYEVICSYFQQLYNKYNMAMSENTCLRIHIEDIVNEAEPSCEKGVEKNNQHFSVPDPVPGFLKLYRLAEALEKKAEKK